MHGHWALLCFMVALAGCGGAAPAKNAPPAAEKNNSPALETQLSNANATPEANAPPNSKVAEDQLDPLFALWKYPGATAEEAFGFGEMRSVKYATNDSLNTVTQFYRAKFPDPAKVTENTIAFGPTITRGRALSATLTPRAGGTLVVVRIDH